MGNQSGNCYNTANNTEVDEIKTKDPGVFEMEETEPQPLYEPLEVKKEVEVEVEEEVKAQAIPEPVNREQTKTLYNGKIVKGMAVEGQIRNGTIEFPNGDKYEGEIMGDMAYGEGRMNYANGDYYTGQFDQDVRSGYGELKMRKGNVYKGDFKNNLYDGEGEFKFKNGNYYVGKLLKLTFN